MTEKTKKGIRHSFKALLIYGFLMCSPLHSAMQTEEQEQHAEEQSNAQTQAVAQPRRINDIIIGGNRFTSKEAILTYIPYKRGELFDTNKTDKLIRNLYYGIKRFRHIRVMGENLGAGLMNLHVIVQEKWPVKDIEFIGNKHVSQKDIEKKVTIEDIKAIDEEELKIIANKVKEIYLNKGYHQTDIETQLVLDDEERATAIFTVHEGAPSVVKQIKFTGNTRVSSKELRAIAITKEDWLLGFLDGAGSYHPEKLEADKHFIEQYYQNLGFLHAKITNVIVDVNSETQDIILTFEVEEGDCYTIKTITAPGNDLIAEEYILAMLPLRPGMLYSRDAIANSIKRLELIWGDYGYIFAHVEPSIQPDEDDKSVAVSFFSELGEQVYLNKITIRGNKKTRDKIIRRKLLLDEGGLITQTRMDVSKRNVSSLGYFDPRTGVNWKIRRLNKQEADLDLIVQEAKTGHFGAQMGFGGAGAELRSPISGFSLKSEVSDSNLFGRGIQFNFTATVSKDEQTVVFHIAEPWLFDKPILGALDIYHKRPVYDEFDHVRPMHEKLTGGSVSTGFITPARNQFLYDTQVLFTAGVENIRYDKEPQVIFAGLTPFTIAVYQQILLKEFTNSSYVNLAARLEQDTRNHPVHTIHGHRWKFSTKFAVPALDRRIGFYKVELDASWYTPLIAEYDLVLRLHGFAGVASPFKGKTIPFGDLFHIGGQNSVRGFLYGQIGPKFVGDSIGASKAIFINAELVVPITSDMSMKAVVFYDGGAGFDNPYITPAAKPDVRDNRFDYRHAIGFGVRILQPMPMNIDWGFKIDPRKNKENPLRSETTSELHFGMTYDW